MWAFLYLSVSQWGYPVAQSFVFAIEEINRRSDLLPNLTLGFSIRNSGDSVHGVIHETLSFLTRHKKPIPNYTYQHGSPLAALIGTTRSVSMASLLGLYRIPQVSYSKLTSLINVAQLGKDDNDNDGDGHCSLQLYCGDGLLAMFL